MHQEVKDSFSSLEIKLCKVVKKYNKDKIQEFCAKDSEKRFLDPIGLSLERTAPLYFGNNEALLSSEEESNLFKAMHFIRYHLNKCLRGNKITPRLRMLISIHKAIRDRVITANLGLVATCVQTTKVKIDDESLWDTGQEALMDAADLFDPWRGFKFSTYATNIIYRRYVREQKIRMRIPIYDQINPGEVITGKNEKTSDYTDILKERLVEILENKGCNLTDEELKIIKGRFALSSANVQTLKVLAEEKNISKERIRQIQNQALFKIKMELHNIPGFAPKLKELDK